MCLDGRMWKCVTYYPLWRFVPSAGGLGQVSLSPCFVGLRDCFRLWRTQPQADSYDTRLHGVSKDTLLMLLCIYSQLFVYCTMMGSSIFSLLLWLL